uniref:Uncharacterized protein n=1 Tax=Oryza glumipatula TaxID=40148 RepID=A0A0D9ZBJ6_9ORYZ
MPTPTCCRPLVSVVDLGGGFHCLCRVAAEPEVVLVGLNATHLAALYVSCGGLHAGDLPAACKGAIAVAAQEHPLAVARSVLRAAALPGAIAVAPQDHSLAVAPPEHHAAALPGATQNHSLALAVAVARPEHHAPVFPGAIAAQDQHSLTVARPDHQAAVYPVVVDLPNCLCLVSLRPKIKESQFSAFTLITSYRACGGLRAVKQKDAALCYGFNETEDEQPNLPPPAGNGVGTATVKQPKVILDPVDNFSNWDRYIMAILEVATGVQIVYALFREMAPPYIFAVLSCPHKRLLLDYYASKVVAYEAS